MDLDSQIADEEGSVAGAKWIIDLAASLPLSLKSLAGELLRVAIG